MSKKKKELPWIPLDGKQDPPFRESVLAINASDEWDKVELEEIKHHATGKTYIFRDMEGNSYNDFTRFMIIEPPKEKDA